MNWLILVDCVCELAETLQNHLGTGLWSSLPSETRRDLGLMSMMDSMKQKHYHDIMGMSSASLLWMSTRSSWHMHSDQEVGIWPSLRFHGIYSDWSLNSMPTTCLHQVHRSSACRFPTPHACAQAINKYPDFQSWTYRSEATELRR